MTVHGQRSDSDTPVEIKLATHQNGYNITQVVYPNNNYSMNDSWNGFIFQVSPLNGNVPILEQVRNPPEYETDVKFSIGHDGEESYYAQLCNNSDLYEDPEYVTLDNNYLYRTNNITQPPSRHLSMIDFKRNQLNQSTRSEKSRPISLRLNLDKNRNSSFKEKQFSKRSLKKITESIRSKVLTLTPRGISGGLNSKTSERMGRERSRSVGDLTQFENDFSEEDTRCYSDDEDGDEFGFLSLPFTSSLSLAMNNSKSPSPTHRILPKLRSKTKPLPGVTPSSCMWSPQGNCTWCSVSGRKVVLGPSHLLQLTEAERNTLQKIALSKLQAMNLGCHVTIPKDAGEGHRKLKRAQHGIKKRSHSANLGALLLDKITDIKDKEKDSKESQSRGLVFGIPLSKCISNDLEMFQKRKSSVSLRPDGDDNTIPPSRLPRKSSSSSHSSSDNLAPNGNSSLSPNDIYRRAASSDSLSESDCSRNTNSSFLDTSSLSRQGSIQTENSPLYASGVPQVPHIVNACFKHIETYGLRVLGIFRVGSSKKRVKQLRDEFDSGKEVKLDESHNPHDVGALLKEFFRDLPEPLLTRDLYTPFVVTRRLGDRESQILALQNLLALLPVPNRDTLWALLRFLSMVVEHSTDALDVDGNTLPGNKMDSNNLATLFGPNIFHKAKYTEKEYSVESVERAEERKEVIDVVKDMIDNFQTLYQVPPKVHDDVFRMLMDTDPETTDELLKKKASDMGIEPDPDTTSSSIYEGEEPPSLPHSPCSEKDINSSPHLQPPIKTSQSMGKMTPNSRRKYIFLHGDENHENNNSEKEKPQFRLRFDRSPSPKPPRTPKVKISKDNTSPEPVVRRQRSGYPDRPMSENITNNLAIPKPNYNRQNSCSSVGSHLNTSSTNSPAGSDSSEQWTLPTPPASGSNSPKSPRKVTSSSSQRPLGVRESRLNKSAPPGGFPQWERERWRQWEMLAAENNDDSYEKETLV